MDIGCYLVHISRMIYGREPQRVAAVADVDPDSQVDRLTSMVLDYGDAHAIGTCSIRMAPHQRVEILGERGRIVVDVPFNAPNDRPCRLVVDEGFDPRRASGERIDVPACDQYGLQADLLSRAIRTPGAATPYPLEDSVQNMAVIDALFRAASTGRWEGI
jgi:predicted dehydrogenase